MSTQRRTLGYNIFVSETHAKIYDGDKYYVSECSEENLAFKCLKTAKSQYARFIQHEADILKDIRHDNIIKLISEVFKPGDKFFYPIGYLMPLCHCNLARVCFPVRIQGGEYFSWFAYDVVHVAHWIHQIASALEYLHMNKASGRVIHKDLKPANVLFTDQTFCQVKLCDFDISIRLNNSENPVVKTVEGSGKYIAPELLCLSSVYDETVDMYSLGVLVFDLIWCPENPEEFEKPDDFFVSALSEGGECMRLFSWILKGCLNQPSTRLSAVEVRESLESVVNRFDFCHDEVHELKTPIVSPLAIDEIHFGGSDGSYDMLDDIENISDRDLTPRRSKRRMARAAMSNLWGVLSNWKETYHQASGSCFSRMETFDIPDETLVCKSGITPPLPGNQESSGVYSNSLDEEERKNRSLRRIDDLQVKKKKLTGRLGSISSLIESMEETDKNLKELSDEIDVKYKHRNFLALECLNKIN